MDWQMKCTMILMGSQRFDTGTKSIIFEKLTYRESLRDIECCLRAMKAKLYHMGIRGKISRSTIADANENRDWRIYCDFAQILIHQARQL